MIDLTQGFYSELDLARKKQKAKDKGSGSEEDAGAAGPSSRKAKMRAVVAKLHKATHGGEVHTSDPSDPDPRDDSADDESEESLRKRLWDLANDDNIMSHLSDGEQNALLEEVAEALDCSGRPEGAEELPEWHSEAQFNEGEVRKAEHRILEECFSG